MEWIMVGLELGVALVIALVMLSVILTVTGVLLRNTRQQDQLTGTNTAAARAQFAAELALRDAAQAHADLEARKTTGSTVLIP